MAWYGLFAKLALVAAASAVVGCATPDETARPQAEGEEVASDATAVHGFLSVERVQPWSSSEGASEAASATFMKVHQGTDPVVVARLVGAIPELPESGSCREQNSAEPASMPLRALSPVEMVSVGDVLVRSETSTTKLMARAYPDITQLLSGVVYTSSGREMPKATGKVSFEVAGADGVPGFDLEAPMPPSIERVTLNGVEVGDEQDWLAVGDAVELGWQASEGEAGDRFYVDLSVVDAKKAPRTIRCSGGASARLSIPLILGEQSQSVAVTAHRLRTLPLKVASVASGEVRLDAARSASVKLGEADAAR